MMIKKIFVNEFGFDYINKIDSRKVEEIKNSMIKNGYKGQPIVYCNNGLLTGSHRLAAARMIEDFEILTLDLTSEVNEYCENNDCCYTDIAFDEIDTMTAEEIVEYLTKGSE
jgi:hypothetical protein